MASDSAITALFIAIIVLLPFLVLDATFHRLSASRLAITLRPWLIRQLQQSQAAAEDLHPIRLRAPSATFQALLPERSSTPDETGDAPNAQALLARFLRP